jgi:hypothetical protein
MNKYKTYCNPMNLPYRFQIEGWARESVREAADPSVITYQGKYWLFPSKSGGYWYSEDLREWTFVETHLLPTEDYAPDVRVMNGWLYFTASRNTSDCPIYRTQDPLSDQWELVSEPLMYWDPNLFQDDDGRVYLFWGCSCDNPIWGVEMDPKTMQPIGEKVVLITQRDPELGWERFNENNVGGHAPWVEGPWMTKHNGVYYLQYAAPGTQFNIYCDAVYVSTVSPLGPYELQTHNPFSQKGGGFIHGAGHGSSFWDFHKNFWHTATMRISVRHDFERRLGLFPAGFDADGLLYCNTNFADYPTRIPDGQWDAWDDAFPGWMLQSYRKPAKASASIDGHGPELAFDEDIRTFWAAPAEAKTPTLEVDLQAPRTLNAVQINFTEHLCNQVERKGPPLFHQYLLEASLDGKKWTALVDKRNNDTDVPHDYIELAKPDTVRYLKLTIFHMPGGGTAAVSGLRVFGHGGGTPPSAVTGVKARRDAGDLCSAKISWAPAKGAFGYNVRWGVAPDKLYNSWMVYDQTELEFHTLANFQPYWAGVEAFNENGVAAVAEVIEIKPE